MKRIFSKKSLKTVGITNNALRGVHRSAAKSAATKLDHRLLLPAYIQMFYKCTENCVLADDGEIKQLSMFVDSLSECPESVLECGYCEQRLVECGSV